MRVKSTLLLLVLLFVIVSLHGVEAIKYDCDYRLRSECNVAPWNYPVDVEISGLTNAHAGTMLGSNPYLYTICCNWTETSDNQCVTSDGDGYYRGRIGAVSDVSNAHVEVPNPPGGWVYGNQGRDICFDEGTTNMECMHTTLPQCPGDFPIDIWRITNITNAHVGKADLNPTYKYLVCCRQESEPQNLLCEEDPPAGLGGEICSPGQTCVGGSFQPSSDAPQTCCVGGSCCTPLDMETACAVAEAECGTGIPDGCGGYINTGSCGDCSELYGGDYECNEATNLCESDACIVPSTQQEACDAYYGSGNWECGNAPDPKPECAEFISCGVCTNPGESCNTTTAQCEFCVGPDCDEGACGIKNVTWSTGYTNVGQQVQLIVQGTPACHGKQVSYDIWKDNSWIVGDQNLETDLGGTNPPNVYFINVSGKYIATGTWTAEYFGSGDEINYYFKATSDPNGQTDTKESGYYGLYRLLTVNKTGVNIPPNMTITSPKDRGIYFLPNNLTFSHSGVDPDGVITKVIWEFGEEVTITGETGVFTNYTLTGVHINDPVYAVYRTTGQKVIRATAVDNFGAVGRDQISILIISSPFVLAYITTPEPYEVVSDPNGEVRIDADGPLGSFIVNGEGDINDASDYTVTCLAGTCPQQTEGLIQGVQIPVANWNTAPALNTADFAQFDWKFSNTAQTRNGRGNENEIVSFTKVFGYVGDNWADLTLSYYEGATKKATSTVKNDFVVVRSNTLCSADGSEWIDPNNVRTSSLENCELNGRTCCPSGYLCQSDKCEISSSIMCGDIYNQPDCDDAPKSIAAKSIRDKYNNPDLELGDIINDSIDGPGCYAYIDDWWCEWDSDECIAVESIKSVTDCGPGFNYSGICEYTEQSNDDCTDGILSYSWLASWNGNSSLIPGGCEDGSKTILCPAEIKLPFFGFYQLIVALALVAGVYFIIRRE